MRSQVVSESNLALNLSGPWLDDASTTNWSDDLLQGAGALDKSGLLGFLDDGVVEKVNENKLAHDVDDLSAIFAQLEEGDVDFSLPCDEEEEEVGREHDARPEEAEDWIEDLDRDVVNVEELSAAFDLLAEQVENAEMEDVSETSEASDDESEDADDEPVRVVPAAPAWAAVAPLDPRSVIRSTIFKGLDPRIPSVTIPRMDLGFGSDGGRCPGTCGPAMVGARPCGVPSVAPKVGAAEKDEEYEYKHDPATCWICKSDKTAFRKFALHRYLEKRRRRNWKRGPRYSGRSHVATNRVREGGRFVCTARWV